MSTTFRLKPLHATSTWDRDATAETKSQDHEKTQHQERRIMVGWSAFANIFKGNIGECLKRQVYDSYFQ